jgi:hypothetical protein
VFKCIFVRKLFVPASSLLLGFFANLRTTCEDFAKKGKLSLCSVPKKVHGQRLFYYLKRSLGSGNRSKYRPEIAEGWEKKKAKNAPLIRKNNVFL